MFKGLAPYPKSAVLGRGVAEGGVGVLTSLRYGKTVITGDFTAEQTKGDRGGTRGFRVDRSDFGVPIGMQFMHKGVSKWVTAMDFESDDFVLAFDSGAGVGVGDIFRLSTAADDGTPSGGTTRGPKAVFGAGVGTPKNEPADFTVLAGHQFGLHIRPYNNADGAGGAWVKVYGDTWPAILLDQVNGTHRATRIDFGNGVNYRLMADIDGANIQTFTLQDIATGHRVFHIVGDAMQIGGAQAAGITPLSVVGHAAQTADLVQWYKGATLIGKVRHDGRMAVAGLTDPADAGPYIAMTGSGSAATLELNDRGGSLVPLKLVAGGTPMMAFSVSSGIGYLTWFSSSLVATTVGAAGGASALPATPTKYLKVFDDTGQVLKIPAYNN